MAEESVTGTLVWFDLTVPDAQRARDFYASVIGWRPQPVDMGDYEDFSMLAEPSGKGVAGVCHARGENADLPPQWIASIAVDDLDASLERRRDAGGEVVSAIRGSEESWRFCVIRDPAGAVLALTQLGSG